MDPHELPEIYKQFLANMGNVLNAQFEENLKFKKLPLARIPWIATKTSEEISLEDSKFFKSCMSMRASPEKTHFNLLTYKFLDEIFPYYLPKRYHTMDVIALDESSSSSGHTEFYTSCDAFYFHFCCCLYSNMDWAIERHRNTFGYDTIKSGVPLMNPKLKAALFQKGVPPEQCDSAADFLLDPWVLSQLLFQPAILHQWTVAVYAEVLQLLAEIAVLVHLPARPDLEIIQPVRYIIQMVLELDLCAFTGMIVLENSCRRYFHYSNSLEFFAMVMKMVPFLELVLSKKVSHILRTAKRLLWNGSVSDGNCVKIRAQGMPLYKENSMLYSFKYWQRLCFDHHFVSRTGNDYEQPPWAGSSDFEPSFVAWTEKIKKKFGSLAKWDKIKKFVNQKILQPGWIQGVEAEDILKLVEGDMMILYHYLIYIKYEAMSSSAPGIRESDSGILETIKTLQADNEVANALAAMTSRLFVIVMRNYFPADIRLHAVDCEGPDVPMAEILSAVSQMKNEWTKSKLMKQLKDQILTTTGKGSKDEECPNMDTMKVLDIVSGLENRIKNIMFGIIRTFFESFSANKAKFCYEAAFIQYVLPSFVVSFLQSTKNPEATLEDQKRHLSFVHHLIKTFENPNGLITPLNYVELTNGSPKRTPYEYLARLFTLKGPTFTMHLGLVQYRHIEIKNEAEKPYEPSGRVPPILIKNFLHLNAVLIDLFAWSDGSDSVADGDGTRITSPIFQSWTSWMSRYLTRIQFSQLKAYDGTDITPVHHRLSQCLSLCDFLYECADDCIFDVKKHVHALFLRVKEILGSKDHLNLTMPSCHVFKGIIDCEAKKLSAQQALALLIYHISKMAGLPKYAPIEAHQCYLMPAFHLDKIDNALNSILHKDKWRLMLVISEWLNDADGKNNLSLATFEDVKNAPLCFELAKKDTTKDGKVKMSYPGEVTFFPIKHCRWCGLVDDGKKEMQLCKECLHSPKYPDKNFFCSQECEDKALKKLHSEEHIRYLIMKMD